MRIAIVDDEQAMREQLAEYIKKYADEQHLQLDTCSLPSGDALLQSEDRAFDIAMPVPEKKFLYTRPSRPSSSRVAQASCPSSSSA